MLQGRGGAVDIAAAGPRQVLAARRDTMGYVSQFLHCVPRVGALQVVAEPLIERGIPAPEARERAARLLARLAIPERLWSLPPATFSGGEQQRVNIARGFITDLPLLLLDEPTASLDARNRDVVTELIRGKRAQGTAILGIFHDVEVRGAVADRVLDVELFAADAEAAVSEAPVAKTAGTETAGTETAGTETAGTETAGTETAGTETAGTETAGTETAGTGAAGTGAAG
jgi:alpha-D-ribose 1-methylphosphonate 5-triphosphate synthase subunit PhnL